MTPSLISSFASDLLIRNIHISFTSGSWSLELVSLLSLSDSLPSPLSTQESFKSVETLILASETIYSPASIRTFTSTVLASLSVSSVNRENRCSRALVAAKKVYFGVGGGIEEFLNILKGMEGTGRTVWDSESEQVGGVGRCIIEVTK